MLKVLNVGGNSKQIPLPPQYKDFQHVLLDIDPTNNPDVCCDARKLTSLATNQYDGIYCSHNLEHYYAHDVTKVLNGFKHVLKQHGFIHIRVPDMMALMQTVVKNELDINDTLYNTATGPITVRDVIYGLGRQIERSGEGFYAHKTGFSRDSLTQTLTQAGFPFVYSGLGKLEIRAIAFMHQPEQNIAQLFDITV